MRQLKGFAVAAIVLIGVLAGSTRPVDAQSITAYEGVRLIVGDGRVVESATLVVDGTRIVQTGAAADVRVPAGAARVNLAGKTMMPMLIDTHVHLSRARDALLRDLRLRAYYG
jgi:imidazolonepropionase-like amidohydrolase